MKPPFAYYGGKSGIARWLISHLPPHTTYIEPFLGSGAVFFAKRPARHEVLNDVDGVIVNFFRVLRERPDELELACRLSPYAREEWEDCADLRGDEADELERARRYWVRINQSFASAIGARGGWSISTAQNTHPPITVRNRIGRFAECAHRLAGVSIEARPAVEVIRRLGRPGSLIYADPPYLDQVRRGTRGTRSSDYGRDMGGEDDHRELAEVLLASPAAVVVSGYTSDLYAELYAGWWSTSIEVNSQSVNRRGGGSLKRTEVIWSNRDLGPEQLTIFPGRSTDLTADLRLATS